MSKTCQECFYCNIIMNPYFCNYHDKDTRDDDSCLKFLPTPGSLLAQNKGCTCAIMDNHYGKGRPHKTRGRAFWINAECALHGKSNKKNK